MSGVFDLVPCEKFEEILGVFSDIRRKRSIKNVDSELWYFINGEMVNRVKKINISAPDDDYLGTEEYCYIDYSIADLIEKINHLGVKTFACCSGLSCDHNQSQISQLLFGGDDLCPYILFHNPSPLREIMIECGFYNHYNNSAFYMDSHNKNSILLKPNKQEIIASNWQKLENLIDNYETKRN